MSANEPSASTSKAPRWKEVEQGSSLSRDAWRRLRKNRVAVVSAFILFAMLLICIVHPEVSHYRYDRADLNLGPTPPSRAHWRKSTTRRHRC